MNLSGMTFRAVSDPENGSLNTETEMRFTSDDERRGRSREGAREVRARRGDRMRMYLDWRWLTGDQSEGRSEWILTSHPPVAARS